MRRSLSLSIPAWLWLWGCGGGGGFPVDAEPPPPPAKAKFALSWSGTDPNAQTITCDQVGGTFVTVTLRNRAVQGGETESFSCASMMATSLLSFTPGVYDLTFELSGAGGSLATATPAMGIELKSGETATLDPITFQVDATGGMALLLETGATGGNCGGGAGVVSTTISLTHTGGACEPVTFGIAAGATGTAGSYTVDCANPPVAACIDHDQTLSVPSLPSGSYRIDVKATVGVNDCYLTNQTIVVPPQGGTLTQTLDLTHQTTGC
jgi:hypothetical protein